MDERVDIQAFIRDYCAGIRDRELIARYRLNAKEIAQLVKELISKGDITKGQYFNRKRIIDELEAREEKEFLKALSYCPVCGHMHPTQFIRCPACGADVSRHKDRRNQSSLTESTETLEGDRYIGTEVVTVTGPPASVEQTTELREIGQTKPAPPPVSEQPRPLLRAVPTEQPPAELPEVILGMIGAPLENIIVLPRLAHRFPVEGYRIREIIGHGRKSAALRASDGGTQNHSITVKVFYEEAAQPADIDAVLVRLYGYQAVLDDPNIRTMIGRAKSRGRDVMLYEHLPLNLEEVLRGEPEGLSPDILIHLLPQILNGVGYSHLHRGQQGLPTRLPHLGLKPSNILLDQDLKVLKLDDCGVYRSFVEVRGHMKHLWQEPGADLGSLAPETFVSESRFLNGLLVDIYGLGVVLYKMATGKAPFSGTTVEEYRFAHLKKYAVPPRVYRYDIPLWLDEMIMKCLEKEPDKRWRSATQMELAIGKGIIR